MQISKNKTAAIAIAIFLTLSMLVSMIPNASAQFGGGSSTPHVPAWNIPTFAFIFAAPNPIGVGQATYIYVWLSNVFDSAAAVNTYRFNNYNLTITAPDGTKETHIFAIVQDTTSSQGYSFTPDQTGNYTLTFTYPGQNINATSHDSTSASANDTYLPSSATTTLTVQQEAISNYPDSYPLPTQYWTRPIYGENPYWWSISSNWLGSGSPQLNSRYVSDAVGSQTAHIMWTKALQSGGVVGGSSTAVAGDTYFEGSAYISRYSNPIIVDGMLYYKEPLAFSSASGGPTDCVDLRTGELIWTSSTMPSISFAYIYDTQQANQHGVMQPFLISTGGGGMMGMGGSSGPTTWQAYDAYTGTWVFNLTNVPSGTTVLGPSGEILTLALTNYGTTASPNWYLSEWNSSKPFYGTGLTPSMSGVVDASASSNYDWNVSVTGLSTMSASPTILGAFYNNVMICRNGSLPGIGGMMSSQSSAPYTYFALQLNATKGAIGSVLWRNTVDAPAGNITVISGTVDATSGVFTEVYEMSRQWVGYSMATGAKLWGPSAAQADLDYYGYFFPGITGVSANGKLYSSGMAGIVYCYDLTTGNILWTYGNGGSGNSTNSGFQVPGPYPTFIYAVGNGVVYTVTSEHTVETPIYKGAETRAINATDGTEIWTLSCYTGGGTSSAAMADGYNTFFNGYDNQIYVVGRGSSATTVEAPMADIALGSGLVIRGTVTDTSTGTTQNQQAADFPNGVPCASDASMTEWMGYVYQQKPLPTNFTGVTVTVDVLDSNNNYRNIGTATTDATGSYRLQWTPDIAGNYTVIATFHGTNGYWSSYSETSFAVDPAAATASPYPVTDLSSTQTYITVAAAAMIVAIAIVGAILAMLMLRKRP
jgi:outer membrane protein assembly factor BamB